MRTLGHFTSAYIAPPTPGADELHPKDVVPFGKYGAGRFTGHPIGLVIALGIILMALIGLPVSRIFLAVALPLGALFGYVLWRSHQREPYAQGRKR
jgi:hypothetical protein